MGTLHACRTKASYAPFVMALCNTLANRGANRVTRIGCGTGLLEYFLSEFLAIDVADVYDNRLGLAQNLPFVLVSPRVSTEAARFPSIPGRALLFSWIDPLVVDYYLPNRQRGDILVLLGNQVHSHCCCAITSTEWTLVNEVPTGAAAVCRVYQKN
jgi:hypothetical protein